ncbi:putative ABC transport system permease protein [Allocatelliglobosispora scoriae]|uniref:Putative ABC transport system permease protein n=1 Tax=Allocatelliglobosispora scoriae TaxID=643052 RepID=A0A841BT53_9ACTN|nr:ABC transporter permease [Allocatelliglobosispora scoriae]MBB5869970.1 putative ABC transport system permease protein [Allocatelliglobosispora scoriae]
MSTADLPTAEFPTVRSKPGEQPPRRPRTAVIDVLAHAARAVIGRRSRSMLTAAGIGLGIAATVATVGVTASASAAISDKFDAVRATLVTMRYGEDAARPVTDTAQRVARLNGVVAAGLFCPGRQDRSASRVRVGGENKRVTVAAAQPGALTALGATLVSGRFFDDGHGARREPVALLDTVAAEELGVETAAGPAAPMLIFIDGRSVAVLGVYAAPPGETRLTGAVILPYETCLAPGAADVMAPPEMVIRTSLGAADQVADEAPLALSPQDPDAVIALVPPDLRTFRTGVEGDTRALFLGLAVVSLIIGALGVSNTTLISVLERRAEIGLRRAVGASRRAVGGQFLFESVLLGLAGGVLGTIIGVNITVAVALVKGWLIVLEPPLIAAGPLVGLAVGALAGLYPAWAASRVAPATSLRS